VVSVIILVLTGLAFYFMKDFLQENQERFIGIANTVILVASNAYGTLVLVVLLSYGLAFLPFSIWKHSNNS